MALNLADGSENYGQGYLPGNLRGCLQDYSARSPGSHAADCGLSSPLNDVRDNDVRDSPNHPPHDIRGNLLNDGPDRLPDDGLDDGPDNPVDNSVGNPLGGGRELAD